MWWLYKHLNIFEMQILYELMLIWGCSDAKLLVFTRNFDPGAQTQFWSRGFMLLLREWCERSVKSGLYSFIILIPHTYCSTDIHWHNIAAASASIGLFNQGLWPLSYHCSHPKESGRQSPWLTLPIDPRHQTEYINMSVPMMGYWDISKHLSKYWNLVKYHHHPQTLLCSIVCEVHSIYHRHYVDIISSCRRWGGQSIVPIH